MEDKAAQGEIVKEHIWSKKLLFLQHQCPFKNLNYCTALRGDKKAAEI